jgi:hypothetical protein
MGRPGQQLVKTMLHITYRGDEISGVLTLSGHGEGMCSVAMLFPFSGAAVCEGVWMRSCRGAQNPFIAYCQLFSGTGFLPFHSSLSNYW